MKSIKVGVFSIGLAVLSSSYIYAGGKAIEEAVVPVVPVATTVDPNPFYIGVGAIMSMIQRDPCCFLATGDLKDHRYGGIVRLGADYNQYIGMEFRALKTFESSSFSDVEHYGVFLKPQYHITDSINMYGLAGYGRTIVDYTNGVRASHNTHNGFSYGVGFEYDFSRETSNELYDRVYDNQGDQEEGWGMWIDYQHLLDNEWWMHTDCDIVSVGITYDF